MSNVIHRRHTNVCCSCKCYCSRAWFYYKSRMTLGFTCRPDLVVIGYSVFPLAHVGFVSVETDKGEGNTVWLLNLAVFISSQSSLSLDVAPVTSIQGTCQRYVFVCVCNHPRFPLTGASFLKPDRLTLFKRF